MSSLAGNKQYKLLQHRPHPHTAAIPTSQTQQDAGEVEEEEEVPLSLCLQPGKHLAPLQQ